MTSGGPRAPAGVKVLAFFFGFGTAMAGISFLALLLPDTVLAGIWRLNPSAHKALLDMGAWAPPLLAALAVGCACSAYGLWRGAEWGRRLALIILAANFVGDAGNALFRGDARTLIGLPIAAAMIAYLMSSRARTHFDARPESHLGGRRDRT